MFRDELCVNERLKFFFMATRKNLFLYGFPKVPMMKILNVKKKGLTVFPTD